MATAIGLRVGPKKVTYAVVSGPAGHKFSVTSVGEVNVPYALTTPRRLAFIRTTLLDIIEESGSTRAGLRLGEAIAKRRDSFRLNLEGIVQELLVSSEIESFIAGPIATISSFLGKGDRTAVKGFIEGSKPPMVEAAWGDLDALQREAVLVAVCAGLSKPAAQATGASPR
jgi:hypothetical protein